MPLVLPPYSSHTARSPLSQSTQRDPTQRHPDPVQQTGMMTSVQPLTFRGSLSGKHNAAAFSVIQHHTYHIKITVIEQHYTHVFISCLPWTHSYTETASHGCTYNHALMMADISRRHTHTYTYSQDSCSHIKRHTERAFTHSHICMVRKIYKDITATPVPTASI